MLRLKRTFFRGKQISYKLEYTDQKASYEPSTHCELVTSAQSDAANKVLKRLTFSALEILTNLVFSAGLVDFSGPTAQYKFQGKTRQLSAAYYSIFTD
jgi:hypothetical protein